MDAVGESVIRLVAHFRAVLRLRRTLQYFVVARPGGLEAHFGGAVTLGLILNWSVVDFGKILEVLTGVPLKDVLRHSRW